MRCGSPPIRWCSPRAARAAGAARGGGRSGRAASGRSRRARPRSGALSQAPAAVAALLARKRRQSSRHCTRAAWCSAPTRPWRSAASASPSRPIAPPRARSFVRCPAAPMNFIRRLRSCRTATVLFEHVDTARLTMRAFSDQFLELYLDAAGDAATASVGAYQIEGLGIQLFERDRRRLFYRSSACRCWRRSDFLRRHGCLLR